MTELLGHNNPPKDRKLNHRSVSINKYVIEDIKRIGASILSQNNCFRLLDGLPPITKPLSIPHIIEILTTQRLLDMNCYEIQENGRNIWEQTEKKFLRAYYSKRGSLNPNAK